MNKNTENIQNSANSQHLYSPLYRFIKGQKSRNYLKNSLQI